MPFLPNIPQSTDKLSISQGNILNNFQILGPIAGNANASSASINASSGFNWINLATQGSIPPAGAAFAAGNIALYSALNPGTGFNELYVNKTIAGPTVLQIPMTAGKTAALNPAGFAGQSTGWTVLPSGALMAWGNGTTGGSPSVSVSYSTIVGFPGFTVGAVPIVTRLEPATSTSSFLYVQTTSLANFTVRTSTGNINAQFTWFAIGR